jgi:hypothetical protein
MNSKICSNRWDGGTRPTVMDSEAAIWNRGLDHIASQSLLAMTVVGNDRDGFLPRPASLNGNR